VRFPVVVLDCLGNSIEEPLLRSIVVSLSLHHNIVRSNALGNSSKWKLRNKVEWSIDVESPIFVNAFSLWAFGFVKIEYSPFLVKATIITINSNFASFLVLSTKHIKHLAALPVDELFFLILENLEPSRVSAPDLHIVGSTSALDIPRLVVQSSSDCQGLLVEVPNLSSSAIWSLNHKVSVVNQVEVSS
jgi:hypothetical protein